jgi:hypothetical protein
VFGLPKFTDSLNGGTTHGLRRSRSERVSRRERERADAETIAEVKWMWRSACAGTPLAPMVYTPSGPSRAVPLIDHVDLGPPITLTVKVRPGQTIADFLAAAPSIAPSMGMAELRVSPFVQQWVHVVLIPRSPAVAGSSSGPGRW